MKKSELFYKTQYKQNSIISTHIYLFEVTLLFSISGSGGQQYDTTG